METACLQVDKLVQYVRDDAPGIARRAGCDERRQQDARDEFASEA